MMLDLIRSVSLECEKRSIPCRIAISEKFPKNIRNALIFSHHTFRDDRFRRIEEAGNTVWHFKSGDLPRTVIIDRDGFSGWSSLARMSVADLPVVASQKAVDRFFEQNRTAVRAANVSKYAQPAQRGPVSGRPYVFVALQTKDDIVQDLAYVPMLQMLDMVVNRFAGTPIDVVIKRHPRCDNAEVAAAILQQVARVPNIKLTDASIHDILFGAEAIFTVNSGVGSEALAYGIPVYCFGRSDYAAAAHEVRDMLALRDLTSPIHRKLSEADHRRFLHYYRQVYQAGGDALPQRLKEIFDAAIPA